MTNIETTTGGIPAISSIEISPELRRSTELFHEAIRNHSQHNVKGMEPGSAVPYSESKTKLDR